MKVIISGGGTGGHIYPAIAIAEGLKKQDPTADILFVGAYGKMEMQKVPAAGYPIVGLPIRGFQRRQLWRNASLPFRLVASLWQACKLIKDFQPQVVVGTGGYASAPILYMAAQQNIPTLIQEQNATVGFTNRILSRYVHTICVAYAHMDAYLPAHKIVRTGNPVRERLAHLGHARPQACAHFGLASDKKCLLVLGGSLGASTINESIFHALDALIAAGLQILWPTGAHYFADIEARLTPQQRAAVRLYPFIEDIDLAYAAADLVVARAGALAIAELCASQKPTIFVPSPNVTANHQMHNVQPLVAQQAALMVKDQDAMQALPRAILELLQNEDQQKLLAHHMGLWARPQATELIVAEIVRLARAPQAT